MAFDSGARVATRIANPAGHSRLPAYLRGRRGVVERLVGRFPLPSLRADGDRNAPLTALYTVCFDGSDVWGADAPPQTSICADLFETDLEPA